MKIIFALFSYLLGAIPAGYIIYRLSERKDIRGFGSRSTGATNILRLKGWKYGLLVGAFDIFKGFFPAYLALKFFPDKKFALICAFLAVIGHCYPIYIKFKGGKGVATSVGVYAALAIKPLLLTLLVFLLVIAITRYVSLGSLLSALSFPFLAYLLEGDIVIFYWSVAIFFLIVFQHRSNIIRLLKGNERKLGEKSR